MIYLENFWFGLHRERQVQVVPRLPIAKFGTLFPSLHLADGRRHSTQCFLHSSCCNPLQRLAVPLPSYAEAFGETNCSSSVAAPKIVVQISDKGVQGKQSILHRRQKIESDLLAICMLVRGALQ
jgi:hypothetical protein